MTHEDQNILPSPLDGLTVLVQRLATVTPKHDMRGMGYGDNGEGDEGGRVVMDGLRSNKAKAVPHLKL